MTTLTGTLTVNGVLVTGSLWLEISQQASAAGGVQVSPSAPLVFQLVNGAITGPGAGPYTVYGNDVLTPANTFYRLTVFGADGGQLLRGNVSITGASQDIGAWATASTQAWVVPPSYGHGDLAGRSAADSHPATAITNTPAGGIAATTVQAALNELDTEKVGGSGTATKLPRWTGPATQGNSVITEDALGAVGVAEEAPLARLHISQDGTGLLPYLVDTFGTTPQLIQRQAGGSKASPTATVSGTLIGGFIARGYGATGHSAGGRAGILAYAAETWTDAAQGTYVRILTAPIGGTALTERVRVEDNGRLTLNSGPQIIVYAGNPEGAVTAVVGSLVLRPDGGVGSTLYVKQTGTGNTGWAAK